ncbi:MAG: type II secretion system protein, partial [Mariniblastus sp.]
MKLKRQGHRNSGFTLLELLLVMAILVVLAGLSTVAVINLQKGAYQKTALVEIETMEKACKMYKLNAGSYPATLDDLYTNPTGMSRAQWGGPYLDKPISNDPWQSPYSYTKDELNDRV